MTKILIDPEIEELEQQVKKARERIWKLKRYYQYFRIRQRYGIDFKTFVRKVDNGTWEAYLADMTLSPHVRESCYSR